MQNIIILSLYLVHFLDETESNTWIVQTVRRLNIYRFFFCFYSFWFWQKWCNLGIFFKRQYTFSTIQRVYPLLIIVKTIKHLLVPVSLFKDLGFSLFSYDCKISLASWRDKTGAWRCHFDHRFLNSPCLFFSELILLWLKSWEKHVEKQPQYPEQRGSITGSS